MHLQGRHVIARAPEELFEKLQDPAILMKCIPGCEELVRDSNGGYDARLRVGFGFIHGTFTGRVVLRDVAAPRHYTMELQGEGRLGSIRGINRVVLEPAGPGSTEVSFEGDVVLSGLLGRLGENFIPGGAGDFSERFFADLERAIDEKGNGGAPPGRSR